MFQVLFVLKYLQKGELAPARRFLPILRKFSAKFFLQRVLLHSDLDIEDYR